MSEPDARSEWLERRRHGIGGSDAPIVLGVSDYKSLFSLWAEKTGLLEPNAEETEYQEWGRLLEEPIARKYAAVTGREVINPGEFHLVVSESHPWMFCTPDRLVPKDGLLQIKTGNAYRLREWKQSIPLEYQVQHQHEIFVTGASWGSFAVLIGGQKFLTIDVERNEGFIRYMIAREEQFWDCVLRGDPPIVDGSNATREALDRLYPADAGETINLSEEFERIKTERLKLKAEERTIKERLAEIDNHVKAAMGKAAVGILPDGSGFSWKTQKRAEYTAPATEFRVLRTFESKHIKRKAS